MSHILFPGDHPEIVYPMFEADYGRPLATHPLQLFVGRITIDRAVALIGAWHNTRYLHPKSARLWGDHCYGAEYNNKFYGVAVWGRTPSFAVSRLQLHRIAAAPYAPDGTLSALMKLSEAILLEQLPEVSILVSRELLLEETYHSNGFRLRIPKKKTAVPIWEKIVRPQDPPPVPLRISQPELIPAAG